MVYSGDQVGLYLEILFTDKFKELLFVANDRYSSWSGDREFTGVERIKSVCEVC